MHQSHSTLFINGKGANADMVVIVILAGVYQTGSIAGVDLSRRLKYFKLILRAFIFSQMVLALLLVEICGLVNLFFISAVTLRCFISAMLL